jgi:hypothetical protein
LAQSVVTRITGPKIEPLCLENLEFTGFRSPQVFLEAHFWKRASFDFGAPACGWTRSCKLLGVRKQILSVTKVS